MEVSAVEFCRGLDLETLSSWVDLVQMKAIKPCVKSWGFSQTFSFSTISVYALLYFSYSRDRKTKHRELWTVLLRCKLTTDMQLDCICCICM